MERVLREEEVWEEERIRAEDLAESGRGDVEVEHDRLGGLMKRMRTIGRKNPVESSV